MIRIRPSKNGDLNGLTLQYPTLFAYTADSVYKPYYNIKFLFDRNNNSEWCSASAENQSFSIYIANGAYIALTNYTFHVGGYSDPYFAQNWTISCYYNSSWTIIDNVINNTRINKNHAAETFEISNITTCSAVNFRMNGLSMYNGLIWCLTTMEIFGEISFDKGVKFFCDTCKHVPIYQMKFSYVYVFILI